MQHFSETGINSTLLNKRILSNILFAEISELKGLNQSDCMIH